MSYYSLKKNWVAATDPNTWTTPGQRTISLTTYPDYQIADWDAAGETGLNGFLRVLENAGYSVRVMPGNCRIETMPGTTIRVGKLHDQYDTFRVFSSLSIERSIFRPEITEILVYPKEKATVISIVNTAGRGSMIAVLVEGDPWVADTVTYLVNDLPNDFSVEVQFDLLYVDSEPDRPVPHRLYLVLTHYYSVFNPDVSLTPQALFSHSIDYVFRTGKVLIDTLRAESQGGFPSLLTWEGVVNTEIYRDQIDIILRRWDADPLFIERLSDQLCRKNLQGTKAMWVMDNIVQPVLFGVSWGGAYVLPSGKFTKDGWQSTEDLPNLKRVLTEMRRREIKGCFSITVPDTKEPLMLMPYEAITPYTTPAWFQENLIVLPYSGQITEPKRQMSRKDVRIYLKKHANAIRDGVRRVRKHSSRLRDHQEQLEMFLIDSGHNGDAYSCKWNALVHNYLNRLAGTIVARSAERINAIVAEGGR